MLPGKTGFGSVPSPSIYVDAVKPLESNLSEVDTGSICSSSFLPGALEMWVRIPSSESEHYRLF